MLTQYIPNPKVGAGTLRHNSSRWQVTELMGGYSCELLLKERLADPEAQRNEKLTLHDCYPAMLLQGDAAIQFLAELEEAQKTCSPVEVDRLLLAEYHDTLS